MSNLPNWFMEERPELLAAVYLTRREDLTLIRQQVPLRMNLILSLKQDGRDAGRFLGVIVKGIPGKQGGIPKFDRKWIDEDALEDTPFPICLFVFTEDDRGYWKWIREPLIEQSEAALAAFPNTPLRELHNNESINTRELDKIVDTVNAWYDSRRTLMAA